MSGLTDWRRMAATAIGALRDALPRSVQDRMPARLRRIAYLIFHSRKTPAEALDDRLWGGFSQSAEADLEAMATDLANDKDVRAEAWHKLARWHASRKDYELALTMLARAAEADPWRTRIKRHFMLEALFLCHLGRVEEARAILDRHGHKGPYDASIDLLFANTWNGGVGAQTASDATQQALKHINAVFRHFRLSEIRLIDTDAPLSIDNIEGAGSTPVTDPEHAVTVIVPVYNAAGTIETALRSIAQQSWQSLKVLVVDDCSTDDTRARVEAFCRKDARFTLLLKTENSGSYMSRNFALAHVETPFVTVHDGDDWSHPQKIERQMRALLKGRAPYNYSMWARATTELSFVCEARPYHRLLGPDHSSGLFRTADVRRVGGWDHVRISADTELFWRLEALGGGLREASRGRRLLSDCPLAFGRYLETSLTQVGATHTLTMLHGIRREYREAAEFWHSGLKDVTGRSGPFFPAPAQIRPNRASAPRHDLLLVADFNAGRWETRNVRAVASAMTGEGRRVAVLHYRGYHLDPIAPLDRSVRALALEKGMRIVAPGEPVEADVTLVCEAGLFQHPMDRFPIVRTGSALLLANRLPQGQSPNGFDRYDPRTVLANARAVLGEATRWAPTSPVGAAALASDPRFEGQAAEMLPPLLDLSPNRNRRSNEGVPVVGVFGGNERANWPQDAETARAAYCADQACQVSVYDARVARRQLGRLPRNWAEISPGKMDIGTFFAGIDVFVYFPHPEFAEPAGYAAALAVAAGVPVVTSPAFEANFGPAAVYCGPADAWSEVRRLSGDRSALERQSEAGRAFIGQMDLPALRERLVRAGLEPASAGITV